MSSSMEFDPNMLQDILNKMTASTKEPEVQKPQHVQVSSMEDSDTTLDPLTWTTADNLLLEAYGNHTYLKGSGETEVECRFGLFTGSKNIRFEPSLLPQDFNWVRKEFHHLSDKWNWKTETTETFDELSKDHNRKRWVLDYESGQWKCKYGWINKLTTFCTDVAKEFKLRALNDCVYDVRLAVSVEKPLKLEDSPLNDSKSTFFRHKVRHRFSPRTVMKRDDFDHHGRLIQRPKVPNAWRVECSKVTAFQLVSAGEHLDAVESVSTTFECELELIPSVVSLCGIGHAREEIISQLVYLLCEVFVPMLEGREVRILDELETRQFSNMDEKRYHSATWNSVYDRKFGHMNPYVEHGRQGSAPPFPGVLPQALSRRHISTLISEKNTRWITEKTDGYRFILCVEETGAINLWERSGSIFNICNHGWKTDSQVWQNMKEAKSFPILVDGEMVKDENGRILYFYAFDMIRAGVINVSCLPFHQRMNWLQNFNAFIQTSLSNNSVTPVSLPFQFRLKKYYALKDMAVLISQVQPSLQTGLPAIDKCTERVYKDPETGVTRPNDGFIIVSDAPYYDSKHPVLKWKLPHNHTVDLELDARTIEERFALHCKTLDGGLTCFINDKRKMQQADLERLHREIRLFQRSKFRARKADGRHDYSTDSCIIEMCYNPSTSRWNYRKIRTEKRLPNSLMTIVDTMERISDGISTEELTSVIELDNELKQQEFIPMV